jgi:hypothetical protein
VSVAYLIRAHHKPAQLARLVDRLRSDDASFYVHVSARAPQETFSEMQRLVEDAHWVPRVAAYYSGFSLVRSMLAGLAAVKPLPGHTVMLSGQDYPLRPAAEIERALGTRAGVSLLEHFPIPAPDRWQGENGGLDRIRYRHFERVRYRTRVLHVPFLRRSFPAGLQPYGGSAWCALSDDAVRTILGFSDANPEAFRFFEHVRTPDEIFLQTVLLNSPLRDHVANESIHYIEWPGGSHPKTLGREDFPRLAASGKLFARKFDMSEDAEILDRIDAELLARQASPAAG